MERYLEQSVAVKPGKKEALMYALCWIGVVVTAVFAIMFFANAFVIAEKFSINWMSLLVAVVSIALALFLYMRKDWLRMEYDYIYKDGILEICGILNLKRRKLLLRIEKERIVQAGAINHAQLKRTGVKLHKWCADEGSCCLCYMEGNIRHIALLDFNDDFISLLRRQLPVGVWQDEKGRK